MITRTDALKALHARIAAGDRARAAIGFSEARALVADAKLSQARAEEAESEATWRLTLADVAERHGWVDAKHDGSASQDWMQFEVALRRRSEQMKVEAEQIEALRVDRIAALRAVEVERSAAMRILDDAYAASVALEIPCSK